MDEIRYLMKMEIIKRLTLCAVVCALMTASLAGYEKRVDRELGPEIEALLGGFRAEAARLEAQGKKQGESKIASNYKPWWDSGVKLPVGSDAPILLKGLEEVYVSALANSSQIRVFSDIPLIRETGIQEARGAFDTRAFVSSRFDSQDDPIGSTLTTGGMTTRFEEEKWTVEAGVRKRIITGAEVTVSQELSRTANNSTYFMPNPQANAKLKLTVLQPLLKGAGPEFNRSVLHIARLDSLIAEKEAVRQLESHLLEIARTYWALYMARGMHVQKAKLVEETKVVLDEIASRKELDAAQSKILRAQSAYSRRHADLVRARSAIQNGQDRLKGLLNDPALIEAYNAEIVPTDRMMFAAPAADFKASALMALGKRPEIQQGIGQLRAAGIREKMQRNEILPELNLFFEGYVAGLDGGEDVWTAGGRQFSRGGPGYTVGLMFEHPLENNVAEARLDRRRLELRQQFAQLDTTISTILLEVKVAVREVKTAWRDMQSRYESMVAAREELDDLKARRSVKTGDEMGTVNFLEIYLDSQERLALAEEELLRSMVTYQVAQVSLLRAQGNMLEIEEISMDRYTGDDGLPIVRFVKGETEKLVPGDKTMEAPASPEVPLKK
jgi:outer membrane protein TolC